MALSRRRAEPGDGSIRRLRSWLTYGKRDAVSRSSEQLRAGIKPRTINLLGIAGGGPLRRRPTVVRDARSGRPSSGHVSCVA